MTASPLAVRFIDLHKLAGVAPATEAAVAIDGRHASPSRIRLTLPPDWM